jgi:pimeloyl-ACP methyl ester carboxylesterase
VEYEARYIQTNGIRLHLIETGPKLGNPVIFLHGFPEFWYGWRKQIPAFVQAGYRVIVPDQRGYNLSDKPRGIRAYRMIELVNDILGLIAGLNYEKVNLVGHDWGGAVAWMLAARHPEHIHRLGILNCPHPSTFRRFLFRDLEQIRRSKYMYFFQLPWLPETGMRADHWRGLARALRGSAKTHTFTSEDMKQYKLAWSQPDALRSMINWYRAALRYPLRNPGGSRVRIPTLMLWGMRDFALTHRMARPSMDFCDDSRLIFFSEATHWVQHEEADEVNYLLTGFFNS